MEHLPGIPVNMGWKMPQNAAHLTSSETPSDCPIDTIEFRLVNLEAKTWMHAA